MAHEQNSSNETIKLVDTAMQTTMAEIARNALAQEANLTPADTADIIMPPKPSAEKAPRWQLLEGAKNAVKSAAETHAEAIMQHARELGMVKDHEDIHKIDPAKAVWLVEPGANRTSVVRRELIIQTMTQVYGTENLDNKTIYQTGSDRQIAKTKANGDPNPEYAIAQEIAGDFLAQVQQGEELTEFELNLASALQAGYQIVEDPNSHLEVKTLQKANAPKLVMIQPPKVEGGFRDSFSAVKAHAGLEGEFQFVMGTNGQYRPKDEFMASDWGQKNEVNMLPPVAIGDEPEFTVNHNGKEIVTASRAPLAYVNEIVVLHRITNK